MKFSIINTKQIFDKDAGTTTYSITAELKPGPINLKDPTIKRLLHKCGFNDYGVITVTGVAHLKPQDEWDEEAGRHVASAKCHRKLFAKVASLNIEVYEYLEVIAEDINKYLIALRSEQQFIASTVV